MGIQDTEKTIHGQEKRKKRFKDILENFPKIKERFEFLDLKGL